MKKCKNVTIVVENGGEVVLRIQGAQAPDINQINAPASAEPVAVDLGLPSGRLWCDRNVGAESPVAAGAFFSWGNTEPHYPKSDMDWGYDEKGFDYSFDEDAYRLSPGAKLKGDIDLDHDAARINMGEPWKMPTKEDFQELYDNCDWQRKSVGGVNGYLVTSRVNGRTIFFPASGYGSGTTWGSRGSRGDYWSASMYSTRIARYLDFNSGGVDPQDTYYRYYGFPGRPVQ